MGQAGWPPAGRRKAAESTLGPIAGARAGGRSRWVLNVRHAPGGFENLGAKSRSVPEHIYQSLRFTAGCVCFIGGAGLLLASSSWPADSGPILSELEPANKTFDSPVYMLPGYGRMLLARRAQAEAPRRSEEAVLERSRAEAIADWMRYQTDTWESADWCRLPTTNFCRVG